MSRKSAACLLAAVAIVALDQATKSLARSMLESGRPVEVIRGFFSFSLVFNYGAAWGMLGGFRILFIVLAAAMLAFMNFRRRGLFGDSAMGLAAFALLEGGIVGNVIDRVFAGRVTDFLDFNFGSWHFPCFNVADSAICIGVALFFLLSLKDGKRNEPIPAP